MMAQQVECKQDTDQSTTNMKFKFEKIGADALHISKPTGWLTSRFHFRFAGWNPKDPKRRGFGKLHVLNDDIVSAKNGFGFHPHRDQEIFSYILRGHLSHEDSEGNKETLGRGHIQFLSAGKGVYHSEMNKDANSECRFLQTWIYPNKNNLKVQYGSHEFAETDRKNKVLHAISGELMNGNSNVDKDKTAPIVLHQDVNVFVSELDFGKTVEYELEQGRQAYLVCPEGSVSINDMVELETRAAVRLFGPVKLQITAIFKTKDDGSDGPSAHFMMIEMEKD